MAKQLIANNIVTKATMRRIQSRTLGQLANILENSFGPNGSNTCIKKENALSRYSKDGHSIIGAIHYNGIIEQSIKDDIESITRHIVKTVGDGTTSAVILADKIFNSIVRHENEGYQPATIVRSVEVVVDKIKECIVDRFKELNPDDVYDIAMISTNGDHFISETLKNIYIEYGSSVFIDVSPSTGDEFVVKSYNGMTLNCGYSDACYVTNTKTNTAEVDHPEVYFFEHPIDTRELGVYLDAILSRNIIGPCNTNNMSAIVPTVIFAPKISQDMSSYMDSLTSTLANMPISNRLPVCMVTDFQDPDMLMDLVKMCGAKTIRKYIDAKVFERDVENGLAPTPDTIHQWAGHCDKVVAYSDKTTFVRPSEMYKEDGSYSELFNNMISFYQTQLDNAISTGEDAGTIGSLKRHLNSLKSNMVELFVGGITQMDRDATRDLVEDAVLNLRSAAQYGVGLGANMTATYVIDNLVHSNEFAGLKQDILEDLCNAYEELFKILYKGYSSDVITYDEAVANAEAGVVFNIRDNVWSENVKTSIMSDVTILDTVSRIITMMATCNQFVLPTAMHNIYEEPFSV